MSSNTYQLRIFGDFKAIRSTFDYNGFGVPERQRPSTQSEVVRNFLAQKQWEVLDWPAYSPDLNPIENIWASFKKSSRGQIVTWENLEEKVMEVWNNINPEVVRNFYSSYENRLENLIENLEVRRDVDLLFVSAVVSNFTPF